ncbi:16S rRNA (uracil(1498)-N(3))-methyltransferase [Xanthomonas vasicola]|uniref:RsmE family RNA methyltransferase n=1 Tax=Xanthomonas vasicola TaxID=56459 RepID=UPI0011ADD0A9|nr:16S rRNA (uracil(1498)-N(3))-methyltransferase [Xanthomonas vasicola]TWQ69077.1 16S rRNA (uracil(1498)-N(3))-methyltransferase [Xanthomonas vasicola]
MRLTRSHVALPLHCDQEVALPEESANHLLRVLRLREGDACILFNGDGSDYHARITLAGKRDARALVECVEPLSNESPLRITLMQGIARGEKMDLILQKATELGVAARIPTVAAPLGLQEAAQASDAHALRLTLDPQGEHRLGTLASSVQQHIVVAIGPEGGWSPRDRALLADAGFTGLQLGPRILRTETAGLAAIAALQSRFGDL